jgi:urease accessory protein
MDEISHQVRSKSEDVSAGCSIFAANRSIGRVALAVGANATHTRRTQVREEGSLRVRFPNAAPHLLEAVIINTAGGMTGGDDFSIKISLGAGANLLAGTAAAEKIYRSTGPDSTIAVAIDAAEGSCCLWLPQETILFNKARLSRRIDVDLRGNASLVMAEAVVFGRSAMGETVQAGRLIDRWRVRRDGRLIFADSIRIDGAIGEKLAASAVGAGGVAVATVLITPGDEEKVAAVRALAGQYLGEVGISGWNGIALARLCARDGATLRHDLSTLLTALRTPLPRLWLQ